MATNEVGPIHPPLRTGQVLRFVKEDELIRLLQAGLSLKQCAVEMKMHLFTIKRYVSDPSFVEKFKEINGPLWEQVDKELKGGKIDMLQRMEEASELALEEMMRLCESGKSEGVRLKAAQDLLDRNPLVSRTKRVEADLSDNRSPLNAANLSMIAKVVREEDEFHSRREVQIAVQVTPNESQDG